MGSPVMLEVVATVWPELDTVHYPLMSSSKLQGPRSWRLLGPIYVDMQDCLWLKSLRAGVSVPGLRAAVLAVGAQADHDPDSAQALVRIGADRHASLNKLLEPSGVSISEDEFTLLYGPVLARIFLDRGTVTDAFIDAVVCQWHNGIQPHG